MSECLHKNLVLIKERTHKLRCRHCHLTISPEELDDGFCPECYETTGQKRFDFEEITLDHGGGSRYRCEDCGAVINTGPD